MAMVKARLLSNRSTREVAKANSLLNKEFGSKKRSAEQVGVSTGRVSQAIAVLQYAPDLADGALVCAPIVVAV
jgi:hypothetical protein